MEDSFYQLIETVSRDLYLRALKDIPTDVRVALKKATADEQSAGQQTASKVMLTVLENIKVADEKDMMVCQDTGLPVYKVIVGNQVQLDFVEVKKRIKIACERATKEHPLRSNSVH